MSPEQPTAWSIYIGTDDIEDMSMRVTEAGGAVAASAFDVGDQGRMAVFQDPSGAFISAWQGARMGGFATEGANSFGWAELNARGADKALPFYKQVFGWDPKAVGTPDQPYTEFQLGGRGASPRGDERTDGPGRRPNAGGSTSARRRRRRQPRGGDRRRARECWRRWTSPAAGCRSSATRRARRSG
jgi:predicted enzyme related to lactoylglutathione lyase